MLFCVEWDIATDDVDIEYTWKCNPSEDTCKNENDVSTWGYTSFFVLMLMFLLKDLIDGFKMVVLSGKKRHRPSLRARFFIGGMILCAISVVRFIVFFSNMCFTQAHHLLSQFIIYASAVYIWATATTDTEVIADAVIVLFVMQLDEEVFVLLESHCSSLVNKIQHKNKDKDSQDQALREVPAPTRAIREDEEEKLDEQFEDAVFQNNSPTKKVSELNERIENLEVQVERLRNTTQVNNGQEVEQHGKKQAVINKLSLAHGEKPTLQEQVEELSQVVLRMGLEISRLSVTQAQT